MEKKFEFHGIGVTEIQELVFLIAGDLPSEAKDLVGATVMEQVYGEGQVVRYMKINVPVKINGEYLDGIGFEIKVWDDGQVAYENGNGIAMKMPNALSVYELLLRCFNRTVEK